MTETLYTETKCEYDVYGYLEEKKNPFSFLLSVSVEFLYEK